MPAPDGSQKLFTSRHMFDVAKRQQTGQIAEFADNSVETAHPSRWTRSGVTHHVLRYRTENGGTRFWRALRLLETETVQRAVVGSDVHAAVDHGETREVIERGDLLAARVQLVTRLRVEHVERRVRRLGGADRRVEIQTDVRP